MALVSKKLLFWFQSIPCWKGEKSQDFFGSYFSRRTSVSELLNFLIRIIMKVLLFSLIPPQPTAPFESEAVFFQKKRPWGEKTPTLFFKLPKGRRFSFAHERWAKQMLVYQSIAGLKHWFSFLWLSSACGQKNVYYVIFVLSGRHLMKSMQNSWFQKPWFLYSMVGLHSVRP